MPDPFAPSAGRHSLAICHHYLLSTSVLIGTISSVTRLSSKDDVVSAAARPMHPPAGRRDNSSGSIYDIGIAIRHGVPGRGDRRSSRHRPNRPPPSSPSVVSDATTTRVSHYRRTRYAGAIGSPDSYALEDERARWRRFADGRALRVSAAAAGAGKGGRSDGRAWPTISTSSRGPYMPDHCPSA